LVLTNVQVAAATGFELAPLPLLIRYTDVHCLSSTYCVCQGM